MLRHRTTGNVAWSRAEERGPEGGARAQEDRPQSPSKQGSLGWRNQRRVGARAYVAQR